MISATVTIYTYGVLLAAAYLLGLQAGDDAGQARGLDQSRVLDLGIYIIISALIGAKLLLLITDFRYVHAPIPGSCGRWRAREACSTAA